MVVVTASRPQVRRRRYVPRILLTSPRVSRKLGRAPGFLTGRLVREGHGRLWTLTSWTDHGAIDVFRNPGRHLDAMRRKMHWMDEIAQGRWEQGEVSIPDAKGLHEKLARAAN